jgi:uncharacterized membrane protein
MAMFSFRPSLTFKGRAFKGLRGWAGKPLHPPLTDIPVGAYVLVAVFDLASALWRSQSWAQDLYHAGTYVIVAGAVVSLAAALTGTWDWLKSTPKGTQARRTVNAHAITMITVTVLVLVDIAVRLAAGWDEPSTPLLVVVLSVAAAAGTALGGTIGGGLAYDYGFNVETAGDHPVWHESERDVFPGDAHDGG